MRVRLIINWAFGLIAIVLYVAAAILILKGAIRTVSFTPTDAESTLFGLTIGAVVAFLVAQLGLAVANDETTPGTSLRRAVSGNAEEGRGDWLLGLVGGAYIVIGLVY